MAQRPTEPFREEHRELLEHIEHIRAVARGLEGQSDAERREALAPVLEFLREVLMPHARAEEQVLYPEWARLTGYEDAAAPMVHDHEAIVERIERLEDADPADVESLRELLYGLHALIGVHFRKEEDIQLPLFDRQPEAAVREVIERMGEAAGHGHAGGGHAH